MAEHPRDPGQEVMGADWPSETFRVLRQNVVSKVTAGIRYLLSSSKLPSAQLATAIRSHWAIENGLHWVLDVGFNEDASRVHERTAARNLALLRKIALSFARANATLKASLEGKRMSAAWDNDFMATLIAG